MTSTANSATNPEKQATREGEKVEDHPDCDLISRMLQSGWSPKKIEQWLRNKYPEDREQWISERTLYSYRQNFIKLEMLIPTPVFDKLLKEIDVCIDTLQELYKTIAIQKQRVSYNLKIEVDSKIALPDTRKEMELLAEMEVKALDIEMRLGIRKEVPSQLNVDARILSLDVLVTKYLDKRKEMIEPVSLSP